MIENVYWSEPSGSRNPLGGFLALDVILKDRTIFSPLVVWVTEVRKCKALWEILVHCKHIQPNNMPYKRCIKRQNYCIQTSAKNNNSAL